MQLTHRNYYQVSVLDRTMSRRRIDKSGSVRRSPSPVEQLERTLDRRVASLDALLEACRLITPLLNALQGVVFFVKDRETRYVLANLTLAQRCGYDTVAPLLGKTCMDVFPRQLGPTYTRQDRRVLASGAPLADQLELHLFHGRESGWCLTHKLPIVDEGGDIVGLAGISHDLPAGDAEHPAYHKVAVVDDYIARHFHRNITLAELTELADLSVSQLERYCKRVYQLTPRQIIHKARIEHASRRLAADQSSITDIALSCGYSDHSAFSRQFKSVTGLTPQQFRGALGTSAEDCSNQLSR